MVSKAALKKLAWNPKSKPVPGPFCQASPHAAPYQYPRMWVRVKQPRQKGHTFIPCIFSRDKGFMPLGDDGFLIHCPSINPFVTHWAVATSDTPTPRAYRVSHE